MNIAEAKLFAKEQLSSSPSPALDGEVLLSFITGLNKTQLLFEREKLLTEKQEVQFIDAVQKRKTGLPVAYITGHKEFFGYDFFVTPDVLIPKPDTEILVQKTIDSIEEKTKVKELISLCDMCTGSGCIAVSAVKAAFEKKILTDKNELLVVLADISENALNIARRNAENLCPGITFRFVRTNLFENIHGSFDIICTNPPYVPHDESVELLRDGRSEPLLALDGDVNLNGESTGENDGLGIIRNLIPQAAAHLNPHGKLLMETGEYNAEKAAQLLERHGFTDVKIERDLEGQLRVVEGRL